MTARSIREIKEDLDDKLQKCKDAVADMRGQMDCTTDEAQKRKILYAVREKRADIQVLLGKAAVLKEVFHHVGMIQRDARRKAQEHVETGAAGTRRKVRRVHHGQQRAAYTVLKLKEFIAGRIPDMIPAAQVVITEAQMTYDAMSKPEDGPMPADWEAFGVAVMNAWPEGDVDSFALQEMAEKHNVILPSPEPWDPEKHGEDPFGILEPGDEFFTKNYGAAIWPKAGK